MRTTCVRRQKPVFDSLLEAVSVNRCAEIGGAGYVLCFLGGGGQAYLHGAIKVFKNFPPGRIIRGAAPMAFVNDDHVEKLARDVFEYFVFFIRTGNCLVETKMYFVSRVNLPVF